MAGEKDYYDILGVPRSASEEDIKKAYRNLAREHHPDMVKDTDKSGAEQRFKEINEAYQILKDPQKRRMYDQFGHQGAGFSGQTGAGGPFGGGFSGFGGFGDFAGFKDKSGKSQKWGPFSYTYTTTDNGSNGTEFDPFDIFEEFFGFRGFRGNRQPRKGKNLYYEMTIGFADAVKGTEKTVNVESGPVKIKFPAGARDGTELRFAGKGMPGPQSAPAGDLFITLRVPTPPQFNRVGDNLGTAVKISFIQAVLGDTIEVSVIDSASATGVGKAKLKIPAGTQPNTQFRLKGKGMPKLRGSGRGDVIVQVMIEIPQKLTKDQKKILEDYKASF